MGTLVEKFKERSEVSMFEVLKDSAKVDVKSITEELRNTFTKKESLNSYIVSLDGKYVLIENLLVSTNIKGYLYDKDKEELFILFENKGFYVYYGVNPKIVSNLVESPSKGSFFFKSIKNKFKFKKIEEELIENFLYKKEV